MEPPIIKLVRYGEADEILKILEREVPTIEIFLHHTGSSLYQFIGLAASKGCVKLMKRCNMEYGVKMEIGTEEGLHAIVGAASKGHDNVIEWLLEPWIQAERVIDGKRHSKKNRLPPGWLQPALHKAIQGLHVSTVELLVKSAWADVNARDFEDLSPINVAAKSVDKNDREKLLQYNAIINTLVLAKVKTDHINPLTDTSALYDAISLGSREATKRLLDGGADVLMPCTKIKTTVLHLAAAAGYKKTLRMLIDHKKSSSESPCDFDVKDTEGRTPLHVAVYGGHLGCIRILIDEGLSLSSATTDKITVLAALFEQISNPAAFLKEILDEQVTTTDKSGNKIDVEFGLMVSKRTDDHEHHFPDMDVVVALINGAQNMEHMAILQHPLLATFLHLKSLPAMRYDVTVSLVYIIFAGILTSQVIPWLTLSIGGALLLENIRRTRILMRTMNLDKLNACLLYVSCLFSLLSFIYGVIMLIDLKKYPYNSPTRMFLHSITILCSWVNVMLSLIRFPLIGEYFFMFFAVLKNIVKVLLSFGCLIAGFALSFPVLFADSDQFDNPWKAFAKTLVMMTGEYDYASLFSPTDQINCTPDNSTIGNSTFDHCTAAEKNEGFLQIASIIVFLIFVIVSSITLMNLMLGLAVHDIQELLKQGRTRQLTKLANSAAVAESFPYFTKNYSRKMTLDLKGLPWNCCFLIPSEVPNALRELALKNLDKKQRPETEPRRHNTQKRLHAMQSSLTEMQSTIKKFVSEQQQENSQTKRPETEPRRDNTQKRLYAMQSSLTEMQSTIKKKKKSKQQQEHSQIKRSDNKMISPHAEITQEILTALQSSLAAVESSQATIQSSLQRMVVEQELQNYRIEQLTQRRKTKQQRKSI